MLYPPKPMRGWPNTPLHQQLISDPDWIAEPKKNGHRTLILLSRKPTFISRRGSKIDPNILGNIPNEINLFIEQAKRSKTLGILDGELIFKPIPIIWIFDLPLHKGSLIKRREKLCSTFEKITSPLISIKLIPWINKITAYDECLKTGDEGVIYKNIKARYIMQMNADNEVSHWIKMKSTS